MVRILIDRAFDTALHYIEAVGLSADTKPTDGIVSGSIYTEVDTGNVYFFNDVSGQWVEQFSFQG